MLICSCTFNHASIHLLCLSCMPPYAFIYKVLYVGYIGC